MEFVPQGSSLHLNREFSGCQTYLLMPAILPLQSAFLVYIQILILLHAHKAH